MAEKTNTILSLSGFARALGVNKGVIGVYKKNGTLIETYPGSSTFDLTHPKNRDWVRIQLSKGKKLNLEGQETIEAKPKKERKQRENKSDDTEKTIVNHEKELTKPKKVKKSNTIFASDSNKNDFDSNKEDSDFDSNYEGLADLQAKKLKADIRRLENQAKKEQIQIAKLEGELIPVEVVANIFSWCAQNMKKTYEQESESIASRLIKKVEGDQSMYIELKRELMEISSQVGIEFKENLIMGLEEQVKEYQEVRSRGERK